MTDFLACQSLFASGEYIWKYSDTLPCLPSSTKMKWRVVHSILPMLCFPAMVTCYSSFCLMTDFDGTRTSGLLAFFSFTRQTSFENDGSGFRVGALGTRFEERDCGSLTRKVPLANACSTGKLNLC